MKLSSLARLPPPLIALGWTAIYFGLGLFFLRPYLALNDDVIMALQLAGAGVSEVPLPSASFLHFALSYLIHWLQLLAPGVAWYGPVLLVSQIFAYFALSLLVFEARSVGVFLVWAALSFALPDVWIYSLTFTTTAGLLAFAGALHLLKGRGALSLACWALAVLWRKDTFLIAAALTAACLAASWLKDRASLRGALVPLGIAASLFVLDAIYDRALAPRGNNRFMAELSDYRVPYHTPEARLARGLGSEEAELIVSHYFVVPPLFEKARLERLVETFDFSKEVLRRKASAAVRWLGTKEAVTLLIALAFLLAQGASCRSLSSAPALAAGYGALALIYFVIALRFKIVGRVNIPILLGAAFLPLAFWRPSRERPLVTWGFSAIALTWALFSFKGLGHHHALTDTLQGHRARLVADLEQLPLKEEALLVSDIFPFEFLGLVTSGLAPLRRTRWAIVGWPLTHPMTLARWREFSVDNPYLAPLSGKNVYLVTDPERLEFFRGFWRKKYGIESHAEKIHQGYFYTVWKITAG